MTSRTAGAWGRAQRAGAFALLVGSLGFLVARAGSEAVPFIRQSEEAPWWTVPAGVSAELHQWGRADVPVARFACRLHADARRVATLRMRALGAFRASLGGAPLPGGSGDGGDWRRVRAVALPLVAGDNELAVEIANRHGPPLLSATIDGANACPWHVSWEGRELGAAVLADDTRTNPLALVVETPAEALADAAWPLAAAFAAGAIGLLALRGRELAVGPGALFGAAALAWVAVFAVKFVAIPLEVGFDARHHLYYVDFLRERGAVPLATDGWSVYHPPLFYALAALARGLGEALAGPGGAVVGLKAIPFLAGLGNVWVAAALCRRLCPAGGAPLVALAFAAVLPMNLYSAAYFSNETFHTLLAGVAMLWVVDLLQGGAPSAGRVARLGALLGVCLVTKYTALLVAAVSGFFLLVKWLAVDRERPARALGMLAAIGGPCLAIAGWFYARNWIHYGDPLMANWGSMPGPTLAWWQQPGFHTLAYFTSFGQSLVHPYLSAFHSFWDSLYSTLWGDGGIAGRVSPADRIAVWNYALMSAGYLLALPATALALLGAGRAAAIALRDPDPHRRAAFSYLLVVVYAVGFGLLYLALRLPYFAQGKASYGLVVTAPLAVCFALGATACDAWLAGPGRARLALRAVFWGWGAAFAVAMFGAYAA